MTADSPFQDDRSLEEKEHNWRANAGRVECRDNVELAARQYCVSRLIVDRWRRRYMLDFGLREPTPEEKAAREKYERELEPPY